MTVMRDVSVSEMLHMREVQHMSNREIAEKLDCSKATVYKMIGAQPEGIRAPRRTKDKPIMVQPVVHEPFTARLAKMRVEENVTPPQPKEDALEVLRLVFGADAVMQYLAMRLYELKVSPGKVMTEDECLRLLREL